MFLQTNSPRKLLIIIDAGDRSCLMGKICLFAARGAKDGCEVLCAPMCLFVIRGENLSSSLLNAVPAILWPKVELPANKRLQQKSRPCAYSLLPVVAAHRRSQIE